MSYLGALDDYGVAIDAPGVSDYVRGAIITQGVGAGRSANSILGELSANGIGIRRSQGLALVRAEQARQSASLSSSQIGVDYSSGELLPSTPPENWTGQYVHQVTVTYRTTDEEGVYTLHTRTMGIKATQPLSPYDATQDALGYMTAEPEEGEEPTGPQLSDILATQLTGVWYATAPQGR